MIYIHTNGLIILIVAEIGSSFLCFHACGILEKKVVWKVWMWFLTVALGKGNWKFTESICSNTPFAVKYLSVGGVISKSRCSFEVCNWATQFYPIWCIIDFPAWIDVDLCSVDSLPHAPVLCSTACAFMEFRASRCRPKKTQQIWDERNSQFTNPRNWHGNPVCHTQDSRTFSIFGRV